MGPRPRDEQYDLKRQRIADVALRLFAEKGFTGTTNRDIAEAAGVSPGLIYWYFENKEDLFFTVFEQFTRARVAEIKPEDADALPLEEFLRLIAAGYLNGIGSPEIRSLFRLVLTEVIHFPQPAQQLGQLLARHPIGTLSAYFERQMEDGRIDMIDPWLAAQAFLGSLVGYAIRKYVFEHVDLQAVDDDVMAATVSRLFARGMTAEPEAEGGSNDKRRH